MLTGAADVQPSKWSVCGTLTRLVAGYECGERQKGRSCSGGAVLLTLSAPIGKAVSKPGCGNAGALCVLGALRSAFRPGVQAD